MSNEIQIADLDCVYLSYDEPNKEKFWVEIKNQIPWAIRVDGVKGSDAAHKAAAAASSTDRFILIDGDNMPDFDFFKQSLYLTDRTANCVFRWRARNNINGLLYGNGGISCWTKDYINNMKTHEASDGRNETVVEFCFDPLYMPLNNCYSTTFPNGSPLHAFRAGFREGVKMTLDRGRRVGVNEFRSMQSHKNIEYLNIWHSIGADVEHGHWATYGARLGTYMVMLMPNWNYKEVQDFDALNRIFAEHNAKTFVERKAYYQMISDEIRNRLGMPVVDMNAQQSAFWKKYYVQLYRNKQIMDS